MEAVGRANRESVLCEYMLDMNQAIAVLNAMHHWTLQSENRNGNRRGYSCTIWDRSRIGAVGGRKFGKRVTGYGTTPVIAVVRAIEKLGDKVDGTGFRIVS